MAGLCGHQEEHTTLQGPHSLKVAKEAGGWMLSLANDEVMMVGVMINGYQVINTLKG